jgi:hypothetical protein
MKTNAGLIPNLDCETKKNLVIVSLAMVNKNKNTINARQG